VAPRAGTTFAILQLLDPTLCVKLVSSLRPEVPRVEGPALTSAALQPSSTRSTTSAFGALKKLVESSVTSRERCKWPYARDRRPLESVAIARADRRTARRVAWCTQGDKYGARTIPPGALQGVTFVKTPHYVQGELRFRFPAQHQAPSQSRTLISISRLTVTGFIDQSMIDIASDDDGGEMDPHGADNVSRTGRRAAPKTRHREAER